MEVLTIKLEKTNMSILVVQPIEPEKKLLKLSWDKMGGLRHLIHEGMTKSRFGAFFFKSLSKEILTNLKQFP